jgi:transcriptional regulator with GAF, ATPase, and Fis domain
MYTDENIFFRQATLRICGSLDIEKAMQQCLRYLVGFMPVNELNLKLYEPRLRAFRNIVAVSDGGKKKTDPITPVSEEARNILEQRWDQLQAIKIVNNSESDLLARGSAPLKDIQNTSSIVMHLNIEGKKLGVLQIRAKGRDRYTESHSHLLSLLNEPFAIAMSNALRYQELLKLKDMVVDDNQYLHQELIRISGDEVIGVDFGLKEVKTMVRQVAPLDTPVLLLGETGVGKEVIANTIQQLSSRKDGPYIKVNCGAIPETLVDSELFGHEKGAFTGALSRKRGRFERANHGTIFLDEIGDLPLPVQIKLLRAIHNKEIERVGGIETIPLDIRIIAATHRNIEEMVASGRFREDLFFRLNIFPLTIPPLRERREDIPALVDFFITQKSKEMKIRTPPDLAPGAIAHLLAYDWPGNVRELANLIERALIKNRKGPLHFDHLLPQHQKSQKTGNPSILSEPNDEQLKLDEVNTLYIQKVLKQTNGRIQGEDGAAQILGLNPGTLRSRMDKLGIVYKRKERNGEI